MASTKRIANILSTFLLCLIFTMAGVMKLTPMISAETHGEMKAEFRSFARVPPVDLLKLEPDVYRTIVAIVELSCVVCLLLPNPSLQTIGHYVLLVIMLGAMWTHYFIKHPIDKFVPALICLGLLLVRLYTGGKLKLKMKSP